MNWTVHWVKHAENRLAELWLYAPDRKAITRAANCIDQRLATNPETAGVPWHKRRVLFEALLAVTFTVDRQAGRVDVLEVERVSQ